MELSRARSLQLAVLVGSACAVGALVWYSRSHSFPVEFDLRARGAVLRLNGKDGEIETVEPLSLNRVQATGATSVEAIPDLPRTQPSGPVGITGALSVDTLGFIGASAIRLESSRGGCLSLSVPGAKFTLRGTGSPARIQMGKTFFSTGGALTVVSDGLLLCPDAPVRLLVPGVAAVDPTEAAAPASPTVRLSRVEHATLHIPWSDRTYDFPAGEALKVEGFDGQLLVTTGDHAATELRFSGAGRASAAEGGIPGSEEDLRPRWIEVLRAKDAIGGLLAAMGTVWAALWGMIRLTRENSK